MKLLQKSKNVIKNQLKKTDYNSSTSEEEWVESGDSANDISDEVIDEEIDEERNEEENRKIIHDENEEERNEEDKRVKQGDYVIVKFPGKKKYYRYVCIVQKIINKSELDVMAMVACDEFKTMFRENDRDISTITKSQIISYLNVPNMIITGDRIKYKFDSALEVDG